MFLYVHPEVQVLDLCLALVDTAEQFSEVVVLIYIPSKNV
jgi:hypothetical protein